MRLISFIIPYMTTHMRAPAGGVAGWVAMKIMSKANPPSVQEAIQRLQLTESDSFVEIGAGHGFGLQAIASGGGAVPSRVVCVEISADFRAELERVKASLPFADQIEIRAEDCQSMPYLEDSSVDKMFAMNVVYFLDPLADYLAEFHRVLKPGGQLVFGGKFQGVPSSALGAFVNTDPEIIAQKMKEAGFEVTSTLVNAGTEDMHMYTELLGKKS